MGGGGTSVDYQSSPEQRQLLSSIMPLVQGLASYGVNNMTYGNPSDGTNFNNQIYGNMVAAPQAPSFSPPPPSPGMTLGDSEGRGNSGYGLYGGIGSGGGFGLTGSAEQDTYNSYLQQYNQYANNFQNSSPVTSLFEAPQAPMPTSGWYNNIAPEVMKGLWEPYNDSAKQMAEMLNMQGSLGGGGQYTGNAMGNFGDFYSKAGTQIGTQAWNLMSPGMNQNYNVELQQKMMPYQLMGMAPSLMPTGVVQNQPNTGANAMTGAMGGAMAGASIGGPYGAIIGGAGGALMGLMGG